MTNALNAAIRQADTPNPIKARPTSRPAGTVRQAENQGSGCGEEQQDRFGSACSETVEKNAQRKLKGGKCDEIQTCQHAELIGVEADVPHQFRSDDRIDCSEEVGNKISESKRDENAEEKH